MTTTAQINRPGKGLEIDHYQASPDLITDGAPHAVFDGGWTSGCVLIRERKLCEAIDRLSDKPDWRRKVFDDHITSKWREEVVDNQDQGFSSAMFDFCLAELRDKASKNVDSGISTVYEIGPVVAKSDTIVPEDVRRQLSEEVGRHLENVPEKLKDWHPGSDEQVLDLVHPSLFPLVYGRTRVLPASTIHIGDCLQSIGGGEVAQLPANNTGEPDAVFYDRRFGSLWSHKFQWLPADCIFTPDGIKFSSYVNNLHPEHHKTIYPLVEKILGCAIPLWDAMFGRLTDSLDTPLRFASRAAEYEYFEGTGVEAWRAQRREERAREAAETTNAAADEPVAPLPTADDSADFGEDEQDEEDAFYDHDFDSDHERDWPRRRRRLIPPQPMPYKEYKSSIKERRFPVLSETYKEEGLQVIVKLANIHLTPDNSEYQGGSWHVEGMLNEMICATALYYYDCENITDSYLAFRQTVDCEEMEMNTHGQDDYSGLEKMFGIEQNTAGVQEVGKVLTRQGRLLTFPNMVQHRVSPFSLVDKSRPGHRKILAFFLVNPKARILSTANVPPQRKDWWEEELRRTGSLDRVPSELQKHIVDSVDEFPYDLDDAKTFRLALMDERKSYNVSVDDQVICEREFFFCEH